CLLVWNIRLSDASPFMNGYEALLKQYGIDYKNVASQTITEPDIGRFFAPHPVKAKNFPNRQVLDSRGLEGRLLSTSYTPKPGHPMYNALIQAARDLFAQYHDAGFVELVYNTKCYYCRLC
ncbi:MAG TPA: hypothetical protein VIT23_06910, partial [Terrimicrobiaceae bacterium]